LKLVHPNKFDPTILHLSMKISGLKTFLIPTTVSDSEWALG